MFVMHRYVHHPFVAWTGTAFFSCTALVLFRLDLFVPKFNIFLVRIGLFVGPLTLCLATQLWVVRRDSPKDDPWSWGASF